MLYGEKSVTVGVWREPQAREFTRCPSYYAADHETLRVVPGEYPADVVFIGGYTVPMPYWLMVGIDTERVDGRLYSGFGGVNYASTALPPGERVRYSLQLYAYEIKKLVNDGILQLDPRYAWLMEEGAWRQPGAPRTWAELAAMEARAA